MILDRLFKGRRFSTKHIDDAIARAVFERQLEERLAERRIGRERRQASAIKRESDKHHERFANDPLIRARGLA